MEPVNIGVYAPGLLARRAESSVIILPNWYAERELKFTYCYKETRLFALHPGYWNLF